MRGYQTPITAGRLPTSLVGSAAYREAVCVGVGGAGGEFDSERVLFDLNSNRDILQSCLDTVAGYVRDNGLLVVGGMAIDFALRLKGEQLYGDNAVPDYDVVDNDNIKHANAVGELLCNMGVSDVAIVPAIHKTTVRVQALGYTVFDVTFVPKFLYDKIPSKTIDGFRFIDPVYQKIDQFTSLALLWDITGPSFNILNRFKKDIKRKEMLNRHYRLEDMTAGMSDKPISGEAVSVEQLDVRSSALSPLPTSTAGVYSITALPTGRAAFAIFRHVYVREMLAMGKQPPPLRYLPSPKNDKDGGEIDWVQLNRTHGAGNEVVLTISSLRGTSADAGMSDTTWEFIRNTASVRDVVEELFPTGSKVKIGQHNKTQLATVHPAHHVVHAVESRAAPIKVFNQHGHNLSINIVSLTAGNAAGKVVRAGVANCNFVLAYFLLMYHLTRKQESIPDASGAGEFNVYLMYYIELLNMMEDVHANMSTYPPALVSAFSNGMDVMQNKGGYWEDENYEFFIKNFDNLQVNRTNLTSVPPKNYLKHPKCTVQKLFDRDNSEYYSEYSTH